MNKVTKYPKITDVKPMPEKKLMVEFENGVTKIYDCSYLLQDKVFLPLRDEAFFINVHTDPHGYGVIWNDEIDLAESEIWINGQVVEQRSEFKN